MGGSTWQQARAQPIPLIILALSSLSSRLSLVFSTLFTFPLSSQLFGLRVPVFQWLLLPEDRPSLLTNRIRFMNPPPSHSAESHSLLL